MQFKFDIIFSSDIIKYVKLENKNKYILKKIMPCIHI